MMALLTFEERKKLIEMTYPYIWNNLKKIVKRKFGYKINIFGLEVEDLIQEAATRCLEGKPGDPDDLRRNWDDELIDFKGFILGTIKSMLDQFCKKKQYTVESESKHDLSQIPSIDTHDKGIMDEDSYKYTTASWLREVQDDPEVYAILKEYAFDPEKKPGEVANALNMPRGKFDNAFKRLKRKRNILR